MELQYDPAGRTLLKITGVLMTVFGAFGIVIYTLGLAAVIGLAFATGGVFSASGDLVGMGLLLAGAVLELIAGILGRRAAKDPRRAGKGLMVWGVLTLVLTLAGMVHIALRASTAPRWELALGLVLGLVTPVVYLIGASRLLRSPEAEPENFPAPKPLFSQEADGEAPVGQN